VSSLRDTICSVRLLYKPFGIAAGILGARAGRQAFTAIWSRVSEAPKPSPGEPDAGFAQVVLSAAIEGATVAAVGAAVNLLAARVFHSLIGAWPDKPTPPPVPESKAA
jgi:hypothetical protein